MADDDSSWVAQLEALELPDHKSKAARKLLANKDAAFCQGMLGGSITAVNKELILEALEEAAGGSKRGTSDVDLLEAAERAVKQKVEELFLRPCQVQGQKLPTLPENQLMTPQDVLHIVRSELQRPGLTTLAEMGAAVCSRYRTRFMPAAASPEEVGRLFNNHPLLQELTSPNSRLMEKGSRQLQEKVTELLASQQQLSSRRFQLSDTHGTKLASVCGSWLMPDLTLHLVGRPATPISTAAVIDLKCADKEGQVEDPANVGQAILHAQRMLQRLPHEVRSNMFAGVTDMKTILWLKIERSSSGGFTTQAEAVRHDVMESICGLLQADPLDLQIDLPRVSLGGSSLVPEEALGEGSTSVVFKCSGGSLGVDAVAVKVPKQAYRSQGQQLPDADILNQLAGIAGVPQLKGVPEIKHGRGDSAGSCLGIAMWPVVESLSSLDAGERRAAWLFIEQLLACLEAAHAAGLVNRDIRPENLGRHTQQDGATQLYILDWGFAAAAVGHQGPFLGTVRCASDSVLQQLAQGQDVVVSPCDDLVSLVRALQLLKWGDLQQQLAAAATSTTSLQANAQACIAFWGKTARLMPPWHELEGIAETGVYADVAAGLQRVMCC